MVLYEDQEILVVNKPAGMLVHASGKPGQINLVDHPRQVKDDPELRPVHRLDRQTSGVLLLARSAAAARLYGKLFAAGIPRKTYLAEVRGKFNQASGLIDKALGKDEASEVAVRRRTVDQGERAVTRFQLLQVHDHSSFVLLWPQTGRRHQLRVHMADLNHPIINDPIYDLGDTYYLALRYSEIIAAPMHLHAAQLEITLTDGRTQNFSAPLPSYLNPI